MRELNHHGTGEDVKVLHSTLMPASGTVSKRHLSTPGEILQEEFMQPLDISGYRLAKAIGVPQTAISEIVHGKRVISTAMAYVYLGRSGRRRSSG